MVIGVGFQDRSEPFLGYASKNGDDESKASRRPKNEKREKVRLAEWLAGRHLPVSYSIVLHNP